MRRTIFLLLAVVIVSSVDGKGKTRSALADVRPEAILREVNLARQNPALYASFVDERRSHFTGKICALPGRTRLLTKEGASAFVEAARFLRSARPRAPLSLSYGLCLAAQDLCRDQRSGRLGHNGSDRSAPSTRINRHGSWSVACGEVIAYGQRNARDIVLALIVDDGVPSRGHRENLFNPGFSVAGAAYGQHARYGSMCDIDLACVFTDHALAQANGSSSFSRPREF
ncbi:MAG: CAP domain-containing protein [Verrucomicrobiota bacterium]|nr:CAP domain-containing protein [Verrucomicrobiota bacterium]